VPSRNRENSKKIGNSIEKSEMPEVGWVAAPEILLKNRKFVQKSSWLELEQKQ